MFRDVRDDDQSSTIEVPTVHFYGSVPRDSRSRNAASPSIKPRFTKRRSFAATLPPTPHSSVETVERQLRRLKEFADRRNERAAVDFRFQTRLCQFSSVRG